MDAAVDRTADESDTLDECFETYTNSSICLPAKISSGSWCFIIGSYLTSASIPVLTGGGDFQDVRPEQLLLPKEPPCWTSFLEHILQVPTSVATVAVGQPFDLTLRAQLRATSLERFESKNHRACAF